MQIGFEESELESSILDFQLCRREDDQNRGAEQDLHESAVFAVDTHLQNSAVPESRTSRGIEEK